MGDGGHWKWPRIWRRLDELERRGAAYRQGDPMHLDLPNSNDQVMPQKVLVVGGGPVGLRLAIELKLGGHQVTVFEKRREKRGAQGQLQHLGFTNRINRPHVFNFLRNDLDRLNGRDFMSSKMCYPVFTQGDTSSIGIDELQLLLLKNALLLGVDFQLGLSYEDADIVLDPKTQKPQWQVKFSCDDLAAEHGGLVPGLHSRCFDVLMGCDGARSKVRESQAQIFGEVDKRNLIFNLLMEAAGHKGFFSFWSVHVRSIYFKIWFKYTPFFPKKSVFSHFGSTKTPSEEFQKDDWCCRQHPEDFEAALEGVGFL